MALDFRLARQFWEIAAPRLAFLTNAVVGSTPAYRQLSRSAESRDDVKLIDLDRLYTAG